MKKAEFKKMVEEYLKKWYGGGKILDWHIWSNVYTDYMFQIITINKGHTVYKYTGWLNEDGSLTLNYVGLL